MAVVSSMKDRWKEQVIGAIFTILGTWLTYTVWNKASLGESYFYIELIGPAIIILGIALILIPSYRLERIAKGEDVSGKKDGLQMLTPRWWIVLGLCLAAEVVFYILVHQL